jgi:transcriptional regulator with XRE-family HTH domain
MNATDTLLNEAKEKNEITSDNQLAIALGITRAAVSEYRHGNRKPDIFVMSRLAEFTGRRFEEVVALIESERETNEEKKEYWQDFMRRIGATAASLSLILIGVSPRPVEAAVLSLQCILCQIASAFTRRQVFRV